MPGAAGATFACHDPRRLAWLDHPTPAIGIVLVTFAAVGVSMAVAASWDEPARAMPNLVGCVGSICFFGVVYASWWLVPGPMTVL